MMARVLVPKYRKECKTKLCLPIIVITDENNDILEPFPSVKKSTASRENDKLFSPRRWSDTVVIYPDALESRTIKGQPLRPGIAFAPSLLTEKEDTRILVANKRMQKSSTGRENSDRGRGTLSVFKRKNMRRHSTSSLADNLALLNSLTQQRQEAIHNLCTFQTEDECINGVSLGVKTEEIENGGEQTVDKFLSKNSSDKCNTDIPRLPLVHSYRNVLPGTDHQYNFPVQQYQQRLPSLKKSDVLYRQKGAPNNCKDRLFQRRMNSALIRHLIHLRSQYNTATLLQIEDAIKNLTYAKNSK